MTVVMRDVWARAICSADGIPCVCFDTDREEYDRACMERHWEKTDAAITKYGFGGMLWRYGNGGPRGGLFEAADKPHNKTPR